MSKRGQRKVARAALKEAVDEVIRLLEQPVSAGETADSARATLEDAVVRMQVASAKMDDVYDETR